MLNIDFALNSFWQFARHWKKCDMSKLELSCETGGLLMNMTSKLGHPDKLHFPPPPDPLIQKKSPSMVRPQERCKKEASNNDKGVETDIEKETETVSQTALQFKCDMCDYINISEKGLKQHKRTKHKDFEIVKSEEEHNNSLNILICCGRTGHK